MVQELCNVDANISRERGDAHHELTWPLDPLLETLLRFETSGELRALATKTFRMCDANASGRVDGWRMAPLMDAWPRGSYMRSLRMWSMWSRK